MLTCHYSQQYKLGKNQRLDKGPGQRERKYLVEFDDSLPDISELSVDDMSMMPIGLADILKVKVTKDHIVYWEETFKSVRKLTKELSLPPQYLESINLLVRCVSLSYVAFREAEEAALDVLEASTAQTFEDMNDKERRQVSRIFSISMPVEGWTADHHRWNICADSDVLAAYVSFLVLKGVIK